MEVMKKIFLMIIILLSIEVPNLRAMKSDDPLLYKVTVEDFEYQMADKPLISWDANAFIGYSLEKIYLYSEGERAKHNRTESENQLVFSHAISPYWDVQFGFAYDTTSENQYNWGVVALSGLSPYFFEIRAALLIGKDENFGVRFDADYEALITQKLILTPSISTELYSKDIPKMELGKGLSNIMLRLRLRYEIIREFAPYIGVEWNKNYGTTDDFNPTDEVYTIVGVSFWF